MTIDTAFNFHSDSRGGDPDICSPTLRLYHKILWSKPLPNGEIFELTNKQSGVYLHHKSKLGEFFLGSDSITHSYKHHKRKEWLTSQIPEEVNELYNAGSYMGSFTVFPNRRIDRKHTINQARGVNHLIDDRFDLTLECIRLFYYGQKSPLFETILRYKDFFELFESFTGFVNFFFLNDLVDDTENVKFFLPFEHFNSRPTFVGVEDYLNYKKAVMNFIKARSGKIADFAIERSTS